MTERLQATLASLQREHRTGVFPYLTIGYTSVAETLRLVTAIAAAGADLVELGIPFSDPLADGPTIQAASFHSLQQGVTTSQCLEVCQELRQRGVVIPLVFMGYYNPILSYGIAAFARDAAKAGADGLIVPDLPPEEAEPLQAELQAHGLPLIMMLAPTSTEERISQVCSRAQGFIYCVSVAGVTGVRAEVPSSVFELLQRIRRITPLPLVVGFGISERSHVKTVGAYAEAVIVGSALINVVNSAPPAERSRQAARFIEELTGQNEPAS